MTALLRLAFTMSLASAGRPSVTVNGRTECPTGAEVTARLGELRSLGDAGGHGDVAELRDDGASIRVTLRSADGHVIGQRTLPRTFSCADLADAIGVVLRTWETDVQPEYEVDAGAGAPPRPAKPIRVSRAPDRPASRPPAPPAMAPLPAETAPPPSASNDSGRTAPPLTLPSPARSPAPSPLARTPTAAGPNEIVVRQAPETRAPDLEPAIELLAGALGGLAQSSAGTRTSLAVGAHIGVGWTSSRLGGPLWPEAWRRVWPDAWGAELGFLTTSERSTVLPSGTAEWRRDVLALGPHLRWTLASAWLTTEVHAEALGALLSLRGAGFSSNGGGRSFEPGFGAGARLLFGRARLRAWIDLRFADWTVSQVVYEQPSGRSEALPGREAMLALGVSWSVRP